MRIGSLFSGYGGLEEGVKSVLGGEVAWVSDIEPGPRAILAHHRPEVPNLGDITAVDFAEVEPVDVLTGGFPCQDVSHAGRRAGLIRDGDGRTRSGLWGEMLRAVDTLRPALVVAENVRGLLSASADSDMEPCPWCLGTTGDAEPAMRALGAVLADLADIGYDTAWHGLRAADVGAPHGRFRVFVTAWPTTDTGGEALGLGTGLRQGEPGRLGRGRPDDDDLQAGERPTSVGEAVPLLPTQLTSDSTTGPLDPIGNDWNVQLRNIGALLPTPAASDIGATRDLDHRLEAGSQIELGDAVRLLPTPRAGDGDKGGPNQRGSSGDLMLPSAVLLPTPTATDSKASGGKAGSPDVTLTDATVRGRGRGLLPTPTAQDERHATSNAENQLAQGREIQLAHAVGLEGFGDYAPAIARWAAILGREAPPPTEPTGKGGAARLNPRFVEWMMGLPEGLVTDVPGLARNAQLRALGNGVVPQQAAAALTHLLTIKEAA